ATIDQTKDLASFLVDGKLPNTATLSYNPDPTKDIKDKATVTPPGEDPTPKKDVNGEASLKLGSLEQLYTYHVNATVPADITKFTKYVLVDDLEDILTVNKVVVKVNGVADATLQSLVKETATSVVTLDIPKETLESYKGKNIELSIEARIKEGVTASELQAYVDPVDNPDGSIPNIATLTVGDNPDDTFKTNDVPVTPPPGDRPDINKTVNGGSEYNLTELKEEHTYLVTSNIPTNTTGYQKIVIEDILEPILEATSVKVLVDGVEVTDPSIYGTLENTAIRYTITKGFDTLAGKKVELEIKAKVSDTATAEQLKPYLNQGYIPNKASLSFNDGPNTDAEVKVLPPPEKPSVDKTVNGSDEITIQGLEENLTYTMDITVPETTRDITKIVLTDTFLPIFKLGTIDTMGVIVKRAGAEDTALTQEATSKLQVSGQTVSLTIIGAAEASKYAGTVIKVTVPATIDKTKTLADYLVAGALPNTVKLSYSNDSTTDIEDTAKVTPPGGDPTPKKDVNGEASLKLGSLEQLYTYHVNATVPADITKFTKYVLVDDLEDILTVNKVVVKVNGVADATLQSLVKETATSVVTLDIPKETLESYKGKNIELSIEARIKEGVTASELQAYVDPVDNPDGSIPNIATLTVGDNPDDTFKTNDVPVTPPPGDRPDINKTVNGGSEYNLTELKEEHTYLVTSNIPTNTTGYQKIVIEDILEPILEATSVKVLVDGVEVTDPSIYGTLENTAIRYTITKGFDTLAGKKVELEIKAKVSDTATAEQLKPYLNQGYIPNKASLSFNDGPNTDAEVKVLPPPEKPSVDKKVNGSDEITIQGLEENLTYTMDITVPETTRDITKIVLTDTFLPIFKLGTIDTMGVIVKRAGAEDTALTQEATSKLQVSGQTVSLTIIGAAEASKYAGTVIKVTVPATIDKTKTLADYLVAGALPNTVKLSYSNDSTTDIDDTATVIPPGGDPTPKKDVNGEASLKLGSLEQLYTYHVNATVPADITKFTKYVLVDDLEDILTVNKVVVKVNGVADATLQSLVKETATSVVTLDIPKETLESYKGKNIELSIEARIKEGVTASELQAYVDPVDNPDGSIPNIATLTVGDNPDDTFKTNDVPVTPPPGDRPDINKTVNGGSEYNLTELKEEHTYLVTSNIPTNTTGYQKIVIEDILEPILEATSVKVLVDGVEVTDPSIYGTLENTAIRYTITKGFDTLAGKKVELEIKAKVSDTATAEQLKPYLNQGYIPNKASLSFNDGPNTDAEVKVLPPPEKPSVDKKVNGSDEITIQGLEENLTYTMDITVPETTRDITKIVLTDTFLPIFKLGTIDTMGVSVKRAGAEDTALTQEATSKLQVSGQTVSLTIIGAAEASKYAGTVIKVTVPATIDKTKTLADYLVAGALPNTVKLSYSNDSTTDIEDTAKVTPPGGDPTPKKDVNGKDSLKLTAIDQIFTYHVKTLVPADTTNFKMYILTDNLEDILTITNVSVSVNNQQNQNLTDLVQVTDDGTVVKNIATLNIPVESLVNYNGKTIELAIEARIKDGVTAQELESYKNGTYPDGSIPNTANLKVGDGPDQSYDSNTVPVTPPDGNKPSITKEVAKADGVKSDSIKLDAKDEKYTYYVNVQVPSNVSGYTNLTITDQLESVLETDTSRVTVTVDGTKDDTLTNQVTVENNLVTLAITENFTAYAGKKITVEINANIKKDADLSKYVTGTVPNQATLNFNGESSSSNKVYVSPVVTTVTVDKTWVGGPTPRPDVELQLLRDDVPVEFTDGQSNPVTLTDGNTRHMWTNLPKTDANGNEYIYTVKELNVPQDYKATYDASCISPDCCNVIRVTNTYTKTEVVVNKSWVNLPEGDAAGNHTATFELYANGVATGKTLTITGDGSDKFTGLELLDANGKEIVYTVKETPVTGFGVIAGGNAKDGFAFANYPLDRFGVVLQKLDKNSREVLAGAKFALYGPKGGLAVQPQSTEPTVDTAAQIDTLKAEITKTQTALDEVNAQIQSTTTTIDQAKLMIQDLEAQIQAQGSTSTEPVSGEPTNDPAADLKTQKAGIEAQVVTLEASLVTLNEQKATLEATLAPLNAKLVELVGNQPVTTTEPTATNTDYVLLGTFTTDANGLISIGNLLKGSYYFEEVQAPDGYQKVTTRYDFNVPDVTVSSKPVTITATNEKIVKDLEVVKYWSDGTATHDGIVVTLLANGAKVDEVTLSDANSWKHVFKNLPTKNANGNITYTVSEAVPAGYTVTYEPSSTGFSIINTKDPVTPPPVESQYTDFTGTKSWVGDSEQDRPASIVVRLVNAETGAVVEEQTVTKANGWTYTFKHILTKGTDGKTYSYRMEEVVPAGYTASYSGYNITNTKNTTPKNPEYTTISGSKSWIGDTQGER
ncbi:isopeptide-forming domain-containing fimbrial protein, partial [Guggenheimella bovis]